MKAITIWMDESEVKIGNESYWIIGQLITNSDTEELEFLKKLREAHRTVRTWDHLHACEFTKRNTRKWGLLECWTDIFIEDEHSYFHAFLFKENNVWRSRFPTPHHYWSHQLFFGLINKMKRTGARIQTMFSDVETITCIMDRRSTNTGFILQQENGITLERFNHLEAIYESCIMKILEKRGHANVNLKFSFVNSNCFDGLQLCDCLTYMVRKRFMSENGLEEPGASKKEFLDLWDTKFLQPPFMNSLDDFSYYEKFNYFRSSR